MVKVFILQCCHFAALSQCSMLVLLSALANISMLMCYVHCVGISQCCNISRGSANASGVLRSDYNYAGYDQ